jgi:hypothetical protein
MNLSLPHITEQKECALPVLVVACPPSRRHPTTRRKHREEREGAALVCASGSDA